MHLCLGSFECGTKSIDGNAYLQSNLDNLLFLTTTTWDCYIFALIKNKQLHHSALSVNPLKNRHTKILAIDVELWNFRSYYRGITVL